VANNALYKTYSWGNINLLDPEDGPDGYGVNPPDGDVPNLGYQEDDFWSSEHAFSEGDRDSLVNEMGVAIALFKGPDSSARMHGRRAYTLDGGSTWATGLTHYIVRNDSDPVWSHPSLATDDVNGGNMYLAYESLGCVVFRRSTDWGDDWNQNVAVLDGNGGQPCVAAVGKSVLVSWSTARYGIRRIAYRHGPI
jgi:hypothetical protein